MAASEPAAQSTPRMTAQLPPRAKAQSTEWRRRQRHWRRKHCSVVDDAGANGTAEAKADDAAEAEGGGSGACGAGDAKGDGEANGNGNGPAHGEANGNGNGPAHAECNCEATCIGAKDASQPTVTVHKLTWRTKPAAHEPKSTRPTAQPTPREPGAKVQDRRRQRLHHCGSAAARAAMPPAGTVASQSPSEWSSTGSSP